MITFPSWLRDLKREKTIISWDRFLQLEQSVNLLWLLMHSTGPTEAFVSWTPTYSLMWNLRLLQQFIIGQFRQLQKAGFFLLNIHPKEKWYS